MHGDPKTWCDSYTKFCMSLSTAAPAMDFRLSRFDFFPCSPHCWAYVTHLAHCPSCSAPVMLLVLVSISACSLHTRGYDIRNLSTFQGKNCLLDVQLDWFLLLPFNLLMFCTLQNAWNGTEAVSQNQIWCHAKIILNSECNSNGFKCRPCFGT